MNYDQFFTHKRGSLFLKSGPFKLLATSPTKVLFTKSNIIHTNQSLIHKLKHLSLPQTCEIKTQVTKIIGTKKSRDEALNDKDIYNVTQVYIINSLLVILDTFMSFNFDANLSLITDHDL